MKTIEERLTEFFQEHKVCTADYAYIKGAEEQDAISRADERERCINAFEKFLDRYIRPNYSQALAFDKFKRELKGGK